MATAGFLPTQKLREEISDVTAKHQAKTKAVSDAKFDAKGRAEAVAVLTDWPADTPVTRAALNGKIEGEKAKGKGNGVNLSGLNSLLKQVPEGEERNAETLRNAIQQEIGDHAGDVAKLEDEAAVLKKQLDDLTATYKGFQDLVPRGALPVLKKPLSGNAELVRVAQFRQQEELDFLAPFEKARIDAAPRLIEQDLAKLRAALQALSVGPPENVARCAAKVELEEFVEKLQEEVDRVAHMAPCHKCKADNPLTPSKGVDRTKRAKDLIDEKVKELEALADGTKVPLDTPEGRADKALADALKRMRDETDENGKNAGKMLGVLVCEDKDGKEVLIYGYSGTLGVNSRMAEKEKFETDLQIDPAGKLVENRVKQEAADREIALKEAALKKLAEFDEVEAARKKQTDAEARKKEIENALKPPKKGSGIPPLEEGAKKALEVELAAIPDRIEAAKAGVTEAQSALAATVEGRRLKKAKDDKLELERYAKRLTDEKKKQDDLLKPPPELEGKVDESAAYVKEQKEKAAAKQEELKRKLEAAKEKVRQASLDDTNWEDATAGRWVRSLPEKGELTSVGGDTVSLESLNKDHFDTPHGVCSAPKMVQSALARAEAEGLKVKGMAEAWFGGGPNAHGELVASCNTCMKNIGFQFCEVADHG